MLWKEYGVSEEEFEAHPHRLEREGKAGEKEREGGEGREKEGEGEGRAMAREGEGEREGGRIQSMQQVAYGVTGKYVLPFISASPDSILTTELACLRCAKGRQRGFMWAESHEATFTAAMHHIDEQVRLACSNLLSPCPNLPLLLLRSSCLHWVCCVRAIAAPRHLCPPPSPSSSVSSLSMPALSLPTFAIP